MPDRREIIRPAAYALIVKERSLLMCRLSASESAAGHWTLPGGGLKFGEPPDVSAVREVKEETGLDVVLDRLLHVDSLVLNLPDRDTHALRLIYAVREWHGMLRDELDGSTDLCAFIPFEAMNPAYRDPDLGEILLVDLARLGIELCLRDELRDPE